jgi:predicted DNA-binding protein
MLKIFNLYPRTKKVLNVTKCDIIKMAGKKAVKRTSQDGFIRVSLPEELVIRIDELIEKSGGTYKSRAEVVRAALRKFFEEIE